MNSLKGYKTITYGRFGMKTKKEAEDFASWYLTKNIDLYFLAKRGIKTINMEIEFVILRDEKIFFRHKIPWFYWNGYYPYNLYFLFDIEFDAFVINAIFPYNVNYFHIAINCEDIKFAYKHYENKKSSSKFELGSFMKYEKGFRFFPNTHFLQ